MPNYENNTKTDWLIDCSSLEFVVMRFLMKLFCTSNSDIVIKTNVVCTLVLITNRDYSDRIDKFMSKLSNVVETY